MLQCHVARNPGFRRHTEGWNAVDLFPFDPQRLAAGRKDRGPRTASDDRFRKARDSVDEMLAIVEDEENLPVADRTRDGLGRHLFSFQLHAEHAGDSRRDQLRIRKSCQLDRHALGCTVAHHQAGDFQRERRLPDAAGSDQGHHPVGGKQLTHMRNGGGTADQPGCRSGYQCRDRGGPHRVGRSTDRRIDLADIP